jgi:hypothetical protein
VDTAIVKLNALADAVGPAAQDHDLALGRGRDLVVTAIVGRIVIGRVGFELGRAGIDQPVAGHEADLLALGADLILGAAGEVRDLAVRESERFGLDELFRRHVRL